MIEPNSTETTVDTEMSESIPHDLPNETDVANVPGGSLHVPSNRILLLIVPLFLAAIGIQAYQLVGMLRTREAKSDIDLSIRESEKAKSSLEAQSTEWQKLATARKSH